MNAFVNLGLSSEVEVSLDGSATVDGELDVGFAPTRLTKIFKI